MEELLFLFLEGRTHCSPISLCIFHSFYNITTSFTNSIIRKRYYGYQLITTITITILVIVISIVVIVIYGSIILMLVLPLVVLALPNTIPIITVITIATSITLSTIVFVFCTGVVLLPSLLLLLVAGRYRFWLNVCTV